MTSVNGHNIHKCPNCSGQLSAPSYSSYNVEVSGPLLSWVKCSLCNNSFVLSQQTLLGYLPPLTPIPLNHGGLDLVGETIVEKMLNLQRQTEAYQASNGSNVNRPSTAAFVTPPKAD
jgi:hypothetical protein